MDPYLSANQALWNQWTPYYWSHSLADIIGALLRAGLRLLSFTEYPYMAWVFFRGWSDALTFTGSCHPARARFP